MKMTPMNDEHFCIGDVLSWLESRIENRPMNKSFGESEAVSSTQITMEPM